MALQIRMRSFNRGTQEQKQPSVVPVTPVRDNAKAMKDYRARLKNRPELYRLHRLAETERSHSYRKNQTEKQRQRNNEKARLRMQRLRQRQKQSAQSAALTTSTSEGQTQAHTRSAEEKKQRQRDYWKKKKCEQRAKLSAQKKRRLREKDRDSKRRVRNEITNEVKKALQSKDASNVPGAPAAGNDKYSPGARRVAAHRLSSKMPSSSSKYADLVESLLSTSSPRKVAALKSRGMTCRHGKRNEKVLAGVRRTCISLKGKRRRHFLWQLSSCLDKQHGTKTHMSRALNISYKTIMKYENLRKRKVNPEMRKRRSDSTDKSTIQNITNFFEGPEISTMLPNKKSVGANDTPKHILHRSLSETYAQYAKDTPKPVSRAQFAKLRPKHVLPYTKAKLFQCLCETCTNVDLKLKAIAHTAANFQMKCNLLDRYHGSDKTLCEYDGRYPNKPCIDRQCKECGTHQLEKYLEPLVTRCTKEVTWQKWEQTTYDKEGKKKRVILQRHRGSLKVLVEELLQEMECFPRHLFEARWQQAQFSKCTKSPGETEVIMVMDFAENYRCLMQQEVQSAHWYQNQVTLHPMIAYYKCTTESCSNMEPVRESIDIISNDRKHDSHAVAHFVELAINHLRDERALEPQKLVQFTDGCSGQYKARVSFTDISFGSQDLKIPKVERHYFGSRHGKNPCDGEGGVVKSNISRAVKSQPDTIINDSTSMFTYCQQHLTKEANISGQCSHSRRTFIHVGEGDVNRSRPTRTSVSTLPGTRRIHAVRGVAPYKLKSRLLSCFCLSCRKNREEMCENKEYTSTWTTKKLKFKGVSRSQATANQPEVASSSKTKSAEHPSASSSYSVGDFVLVKLPMGKRHATFVAEVLKLLDKEIQLKYMEEDGMLFKWPAVADISVEPSSHVVQKLPFPKLVERRSTSRVQLFTFKQ